MSESDFHARIAAIEQLNLCKTSVSFSLCNPADVGAIQRAHRAVGWSQDEVWLCIDKVNVMEFSKDVNLINHLNLAYLQFKCKKTDTTWIFPPEYNDRRQRWPVLAVKKKRVDENDNIINPSEQPLEIDSRAMKHFSQVSDWVFVDGFGSGTALVAALREARSVVGPSPTQCSSRMPETDSHNTSPNEWLPT